MSVEKTLVIKTDKILACSSHPHPSLDLPKGIEGDGSGSGLAVGGVERVVGGTGGRSHSSRRSWLDR